MIVTPLALELATYALAGATKKEGFEKTVTTLLL